MGTVTNTKQFILVRPKIWNKNIVNGFKFFTTSKISQLPKSPGVYLFKRGKDILYIGKAANLRERVKQHRALLNQVKHVAHIETGSEIAALILEAKLIKKYKPKYNVLWRDDKNYFYVALTREKLPRVFITHQPKLKIDNWKLKINYIGPFVDGKALKQTLKYLRKVFPYYSTRTHPQGRCSWCHLELCPGPNPNLKDYRQNIKNLVKVLKGEKKQVLIRLKRAMAKESRGRNFEAAARERDRFISLEKVMTHGKILDDAAAKESRSPYRRIEGYDIANIQGKFATGAMVVFSEGRPDKKYYRKFKIRCKSTPDDTAMLSEVLLRRFRHTEWPLPELILVDGGKAQLNATVLIAKSFKLKAEIIALTKDKKHRGVKIYTAGKKKPTQLSKLPEAMRNLLLRVNSGAHRFAISYYRNLHRKSFG